MITLLSIDATERSLVVDIAWTLFPDIKDAALTNPAPPVIASLRST
jgi:hypothetical protein